MSAEAARLAAIYDAWSRGEEPPDFTLGAAEAAAEADRIAADNSELRSLGGEE